MSEDLLVRLGPENPDHEKKLAHDLGIDPAKMVNLVDIATPRGIISQRKRRRLSLVAIPSSRPELECKFVPFLFWLIAARPRQIISAGASQRPSTTTLGPFLARSIPAAVAQIVGAALTMMTHVFLLLILGSRMEARQFRESPKKILYVRTVAGYSSSVGGSITHANEVIKGLRAIGCEVEIREAVLSDPALTDADEGPIRWGVPLVSRLLPGFVAMGGDLVLAWRSRRSARWSETIYQRLTPCSAAGLVLATWTRKPLVLEYNNAIDHEGSQVFLSRYERHIERLNLKFASRIVVVSQVLVDSLIERGIEPERLVLNPNAVDPARFRSEGAAKRKALGFRDGDVVYCFVGTFGFWHGAPVLARAFARVADNLPDARLLMVGDGVERAETEALLVASGHSDRADFLGSVPMDEVPSILEAADVLCSPHVPWRDGLEFHGSPTKLFEYMASGTAIVASSLGQISDVLEDEVSALLVEPGSVGELADAMTRLAQDPDLRKKLGEIASREARLNHTWEDNAERIVAVNSDCHE